MRWEAVTGTPNVLSGVNSIFTAPLVADPGTKFEYGINADWLGKVIEAASGVTLDVAVKDGITGPLGMDATTFLRNSEQAANTTPIHVKGTDGTWTTSAANLVEEPEYWAGGHGLYSTPRDYIKFQRALLGGGELDGVRILTQSSVDAAFTNGDRRPGLPGGDRDRRPCVDVHIVAYAPIQAWATACCSTPLTSRECAGRTAVPGPGCSTPTLGGPGQWGLRLDLQQLPAIWSAGGARAVRQLRTSRLHVSVVSLLYCRAQRPGTRRTVDGEDLDKLMRAELENLREVPLRWSRGGDELRVLRGGA